MSVDNTLRGAVTPLVPVCVRGDYDGAETEYCTYQYSEVPALLGDDEAGALRYLIQLHWFLPSGVKSKPKRARLRAALTAAGFTAAEVTDASDSDGQHYVLEVEYCDGDL